MYHKPYALISAHGAIRSSAAPSFSVSKGLEPEENTGNHFFLQMFSLTNLVWNAQSVHFGFSITVKDTNVFCKWLPFSLSILQTCSSLSGALLTEALHQKRLKTASNISAAKALDQRAESRTRRSRSLLLCTKKALSLSCQYVGRSYIETWSNSAKESSHEVAYSATYTCFLYRHQLDINVRWKAWDCTSPKVSSQTETSEQEPETGTHPNNSRSIPCGWLAMKITPALTLCLGFALVFLLGSPRQWPPRPGRWQFEELAWQRLSLEGLKGPEFEDDVSRWGWVQNMVKSLCFFPSGR